jgi:IS4 transposase
MTSYPALRRSFQQVLRSFLQDDGNRFGEVLTHEQIERAAQLQNLSFGNGVNAIYSLPVTLWAFVTQAASESKSCLAAVARVLAWLASQGRPVANSGAGAYCKARAKLTELFLWFLTCDVGRQLEEQALDEWRWHGKRVVMVDGSTLSMPDTPANQAEYPQSRSQQPGVGFPIIRWVAMLGLATGAVLDSAFGPYRGKQTGETALFRSLLSSLRPGDVVLADRYYCSYWLVALLLAQGVDVVFRKHHLRHTDFRRGHRLGRNDHIVTWTKPECPEWMDAATYETLPDTLALREMRTQLAIPGCRVEQIIVITTLCDPDTFPPADILELYHQRWHAETNFRHLKQTLKMDVLRCKTVEGVQKELTMYALVYNIVRLVMLEAAHRQKVPIERMSFVDAVRWLAETVSSNAPLELHVNLHRPGRAEPRVKKRGPKQFDLMNQPRHVHRKRLLDKANAA